MRNNRKAEQKRKHEGKKKTQRQCLPRVVKEMKLKAHTWGRHTK